MSQISKKSLYAEYLKLAEASGIERPKAIGSFTNIKAVQAAVDYLKAGQVKPTEESKKVKAAKKAGPVPVAGNFMKLTPSDRAKLRRMVSEGKVEHPWGGRWELTKADYDRLLGGAASR